MTDWPALEAANGPLNAFVDWDRQVTGSAGALADLTIGVKANIAVKGLPWTGGMALYRDRIAADDAEVVKMLRAKGAAIIGSLNLEEAALGAKTDNPWFGATQNPHRIGHTPGGSSGGSGAAVAAGLCDAALGTDTLGSIRIPAAYCGIYGFKPANAAVSQDGLEIAEASFDCIGPLARSLDALERVARVMSRFGEGNASGVAVLSDLGGVECQPGVLDAYAKAGEAAGIQGSVILPHPLSRVRYAGFIKTSKALAAHLANADPGLLSDVLKRLLSYGPRRSPEDWAEDKLVLSDTADAVRAVVDRHGALLLPTTPQAAFPHTAIAPSNQADFTALANIAGLPALAIPAGWQDDLPVGVQLIGATGAEAGLFALARQLDSHLAAYRAPAHFLAGALP